MFESLQIGQALLAAVILFHVFITRRIAKSLEVLAGETESVSRETFAIVKTDSQLSLMFDQP